MKKLLVATFTCAVVLGLITLPISTAKDGSPSPANGTTKGWILNGDFADSTTLIWDTGGSGYVHWRGEGYQTHVPSFKKWDMLRTEVKYSNAKELRDGAPARYLEFKTVGSGHDGAGITLRYIPFVGVYGDGVNPGAPTSWKNVDGLQLDLSASTLDPNKFYYLEAEVFIDHHNLKDSGWWGGSEWPVQIRMNFADALNGGKRFIWGFLDGIDEQGIRPYTQIQKKTWYHFRSPELRTLWDVRGKSVTYPLQRLYGVSVSAQGWELKSRIANIRIVEYSSAQVTTPDDPNSVIP